MLTGLPSFLRQTPSHTGSRYADPAECARGEKNTRADDAARVRPPRVSALRLGCPPRPFGCTFINTSFPTSHRCLCPLSFFFDCFVFRAFSGKIRDACVLSEPAPARFPCTLPNSSRVPSHHPVPCALRRASRLQSARFPLPLWRALHFPSPGHFRIGGVPNSPAPLALATTASRLQPAGFLFGFPHASRVHGH